MAESKHKVKPECFTKKEKRSGVVRIDDGRGKEVSFCGEEAERFFRVEVNVEAKRRDRAMIEVACWEGSSLGGGG